MTGSTWATALVGLLVLSAAAGTAPVSAPTVAAANTVASAAAASTAAARTAAASTAAGVDIREVELTVPRPDGPPLPATLRVPVDSRAGLPAMVLVHGAGVGPREKLRAEAEAFTRAGIATLTYDKRTVGYSLTERSYSRLADDAVAAAEVLRAQPGVDPTKVGLWGLSEGGWVAPLAASRAPRTAFLIVVGANGVAPLRQQTWAEALKVQMTGVQGSLVDAASSGTYRLIADLGMFPEPYYDPAPVLRSLRMPVLGIWGAVDRATPPVESVTAFRDGLDRAGNPHYVLRTFDGAEHALHNSADGFVKGPDFVPGYVELVGSWVSGVAAGRPAPTSVTGTGQQPRATASVLPLAWFESAPAHGVALVVMLVGFVGFGVIAAWRRIRGTGRIAGPGTGPAGGAAAAGMPRGLRVSARVLAIGGLTTVLGTMTYLSVLTITRGGRLIDPGPLLAGRTLPWLAVQAVAVVTVVAGIVVVAHVLAGVPRGHRAGGIVTATRTERVRVTLLLAAAAAFVPWSLYWGLLSP